jgi:hypothetical protein
VLGGLEYVYVTFVRLPEMRAHLAHLTFPPGFVDPGDTLRMQAALWGMYARVLRWPVDLAVQVGVMACLSALCRRTPAALLFCYLYGALRGVLAGALVMHLLGPMPAVVLLRVLIAFALDLLLFRLLLPHALRSLEYPDEPPPARKPAPRTSPWNYGLDEEAPGTPAG